MLWLVLAILVAFFQSLSDVWRKYSVRHVNEYVVLWAATAGALIFFTPFVLVKGFPAIDGTYVVTALIVGVLAFFANLLSIRALKASDMSVAIPLLTLTPVFLLVTSAIILGEIPPLLGIAGVLIVFIGAYMQNIRERSKGFLGPFRALLQEKGARLMLVVAFIYSITTTIDKIGVRHSSPVAWPLGVYVVIFVLTTIRIATHKEAHFRDVIPHARMLAPLGPLVAVTLMMQMTAIQMTLVSYVNAIKRLSVDFSMLWAALLFNEKRPSQHYIGATIMVAGAILIALA